ncbi:hypothetical protein ENTCAN_06590 [Enterobacter cancerogenus ATCC 35316]|nr:hypothetical protein ENTCAN_06590 [Enterobacter cancerogenus ATCC 35316]
MTSPFDAIETLFYKSVTRVTTLFAFLPSATKRWQKQKGFNRSILLL